MLKNQDRVCISPCDLGFFILQKVVDFAFVKKFRRSIGGSLGRFSKPTSPAMNANQQQHQDEKMKRRLFSTLHRLQHENPLVVLLILISKPD